MLRQKQYIICLEVNGPDGRPVLCELGLTPIGSSDINQDSFWMQQLRSFAGNPTTEQLAEWASSRRNLLRERVV